MLQMEILWRLQCIDREIHVLKKDKRLKELQDRLTEIRNNYNSLKGTAEEYMNHKKENDLETARLNDDLNGLDHRLKESNSRLYQNGQNLKAVDNLQREIDAHKLKIDEIENKLLKYIEVGEKLENDSREIRKKLSAFKDEFNKLKALYEEESAKNRAALDRLNVQREAVIKEIDPKLVEQYNNIVLKKINAVSEVVDGICEECGVKLSSMLYDMVKKKNNICCCEYCGRILYYD